MDNEITTTLELTAEDFQAIALQLGVPQLQAQIKNMNKLIDQLLAYVNQVDDRIAELNGEGRVTRHVTPHFNLDTGNVEFNINVPDVPDDMPPPSFIAQEAAKRGVSQLVRNGQPNRKRR